MKKITFTICLAITLTTVGQSRKDFKWLEGTWRRENNKPGTMTLEKWVITKEAITGQGITVKERDTTFMENLKIVKEGGNWSYVAEVAHNPTPTYFKITEVTSDGFVSSNPAHDFPKKITYLKTKTGMIVTISGDEKQIPFVFVRTDR